MDRGRCAEDHLFLLAEQDGEWNKRQFTSGPDGGGQDGGRSSAPDHVRSVQSGPGRRAGLYAVRRATNARPRSDLLSGPSHQSYARQEAFGKSNSWTSVRGSKSVQPALGTRFIRRCGTIGPADIDYMN